MEEQKMTNEQAKELIKNMYESLNDENGLTEEENYESVAINFILQYRYGEITREDLETLLTTLKYDVDYDVIEKEKAKYEKRKTKRS